MSELTDLIKKWRTKTAQYSIWDDAADELEAGLKFAQFEEDHLGVRPAHLCDCGGQLTLCESCAVAGWQAAHPDCPACCPSPNWRSRVPLAEHHMKLGEHSTLCGAKRERGNSYYEWAYVTCPDCLALRGKSMKEVVVAQRTGEYHRVDPQEVADALGATDMLAAEMELWGNTPEQAFAALLAEYQALKSQLAEPTTHCAGCSKEMPVKTTPLFCMACVTPALNEFQGKLNELEAQIYKLTLKQAACWCKGQPKSFHIRKPKPFKVPHDLDPPLTAAQTLDSYPIPARQKAKIKRDVTNFLKKLPKARPKPSPEAHRSLAEQFLDRPTAKTTRKKRKTRRK